MSSAEPIREATTADVERLLELQSACFGAEAWTRGMVEEELRRPGSIFLVAGRPAVAFACAWAVLDDLHLLQIAVHPACRRAGHASRLHAAVLDAARRHAVAGWLEVRADNPGAIALYEQHGWEQVGKRARY
ncbi:MAG: GNAT family N-acetyltransferase, partial [Deltaproteobacteria bacterium]|nr:GNAT family N-acetyltransferase [Deltaproteobacteria bacterium]